MSANIKNLRTRIKSVNNTLHLTNAMGLVASSKIRKATIAMNNSRSYVDSIEKISSTLSTFPECQKSIYMKENDSNIDRVIVIAGDRGLAGGYNINVFNLMKEQKDAQFIPIGKRACEKVKTDIISCEGFSFEDAEELVNKQCQDFKESKFKRLGIISTKYISIMKQEANIEWILPLNKSNEKSKSSMIFEPNEEDVLNYLIPQLLTGKIIAAIKESFLCEVAARRMAMDSASKNATQMIDDLKLEYNRARQSTITQEITEIVAGASQ